MFCKGNILSILIYEPLAIINTNLQIDLNDCSYTDSQFCNDI